MKRILTFIVLGLISTISYSKNIWEEIKDKDLSDLLYSENGQIISTQHGYAYGHFMLYHIMVNNKLYKCTDKLDDIPVDDGKAESTNCYRLKNK